ncbi:MAG: hypothetical protein RLZZ501_1930 [Pseudomonadota bacterium]|jgi:hypothetical protein
MIGAVMIPARFSRGGEFIDPDQEPAFRPSRLDENGRLLALVFKRAALVNILFHASDPRFLPGPHFPAAIAARTDLGLVSLPCWALAAERAAPLRPDGTTIDPPRRERSRA